MNWECVEDLTAEDVIDSRDVADWLEDWDNSDDLPSERAHHLARILRELDESGEDYSEDWKYGATLIRDSHFRDYAQELAEDCGMVPEGLTWPLTCIDWDRAARDLQVDYTAIDVAGTTYWVR